MKRVLVTVVTGLALVLGVTAPAPAATTGAQTFNFVVLGDGDQGTVFATGPIEGKGTSTVLTDDGEGHGTDRLAFKHGSVVVDHTDSSYSDSFNEQTCVARFRGAGDYTISGGRGAYKGVTGSGTYSYKGTFFGVRTPDGCSDDGFVYFTVKAIGVTTLP